MTDEQIEKIAIQYGDIIYSVFTRLQHIGAKKSRLSQMITDTIKRLMIQAKDK